MPPLFSFAIKLNFDELRGDSTLHQLVQSNRKAAVLKSAPISLISTWLIAKDSYVVATSVHSRMTKDKSPNI